MRIVDNRPSSDCLLHLVCTSFQELLMSMGYNFLFHYFEIVNKYNPYLDIVRNHLI